jgi:hypothetical protein
MRQASIYNQADIKFLTFAGSIYGQCNEHATDWLIDRERLARLKALADSARKAYEANMDPYTRNHLTSVEKKVTLGELKAFISVFINYLTGNEAVTDEGLEQMNLRPRRRQARLPLPAPAEAPLLSARTLHGEIRVYAVRREHGHPTQGVQHRHYHGFKLRWRFEDETDWRIELSTRLRHTLRFEGEDTGRSIVLCIAWVNPRLQEGPWSDSVSKVIA